MSSIDSFADDARSVDELIHAALCEPEEPAWDAVCALHFRGTQEVFDRATLLCRSECPHERCLGADILGQLGVPARTYPEASTNLLLSMLEQETNADVLQAILMALYHLGDDRAILVGPRFASHPDPDVRHAVVMVISGHDDKTSIDLLIRMTKDAHPLVRDWATWGLGTLTEVDSPEIRMALADRMDDDDEETRLEALMGLARRRDQRVIPTLKEEMAQESVAHLAIEAVAAIRAPELYPHLIALRDRLQSTPGVLEEAIAACRPASL
jgi:HEAT repeat protein